MQQESPVQRSPLDLVVRIAKRRATSWAELSHASALIRCGHVGQTFAFLERLVRIPLRQTEQVADKPSLYPCCCEIHSFVRRDYASIGMLYAKLLQHLKFSIVFLLKKIIEILYLIWIMKIVMVVPNCYIVRCAPLCQFFLFPNSKTPLFNTILELFQLI